MRLRRSRGRRRLDFALGCGTLLAALGASASSSGASSTATPDLPVTARGCGVKGVALQVLGSGGPELQDKRASSSYLIWRDNVPTVLVDSGGGAALRFGESGATVSDLDVILLTHLHIDHTADLAALVKSSWFEDRHRALPVYGPAANQFFPATSEYLRTLFADPHGAYRYLSQFLTPGADDAYLLEAHDVTPGPHEIRRIYDSHGLRIMAASVVHGGVPAIAYRVELGGISIAFSGDTDGNNGNLEKVAQNATILVAHNAVRDGATGIERALHMPPSVIGRIAATASVRRLVLSHRMLRTLGHEAETTTAIRSSYKGPLSFADDLQCFEVSP